MDREQQAIEFDGDSSGLGYDECRGGIQGDHVNPSLAPFLLLVGFCLGAFVTILIATYFEYGV